jgi:hypothetical protein
LCKVEAFMSSEVQDYGGWNLHVGMRQRLGQPRHVGVTSEGGLFLG